MTEFNKLFKLPTASNEVLSKVEHTIFKIFLDKKELETKLEESRFNQKINGTNYSVSLSDEFDYNREKLIAQHLALWTRRHFKSKSNQSEYFFMGNIPLHIADFDPNRNLNPMRIYEELKALKYSLYDHNTQENISLNNLDLFFNTILNNKYNLKTIDFTLSENNIEVLKNEFQ